MWLLSVRCCPFTSLYFRESVSAGRLIMVLCYVIAELGEDCGLLQPRAGVDASKFQGPN